MENSPTALFVHLGAKLPKYLIENVARTATLFPWLRIVMVSDANNVQDLPNQSTLIRPDSLSWNRGRPELLRDQRFWSGWWQKTFDRLLMIRPVHELYKESPILQIESDTVLFPSFPFGKLGEVSKLSFPKCAADTGVGSVIFSSKLEYSQFFEEKLLDLVTKNRLITDMSALGHISNAFPDIYTELIEFPKVESDAEHMGMFDGSSHGEWICGQDPKAHWGVGRRRQRTRNSRDLDMPKYELIDNQLYAVSSDTKFPLHNLHVHSKELYFFQLGTNPRFRKTLVQINKEHSSDSTFFNLFGFFFCLRSNVRIWISSITSKEAWMRLINRMRNEY